MHLQGALLEQTDYTITMTQTSTALILTGWCHKSTNRTSYPGRCKCSACSGRACRSLMIARITGTRNISFSSSAFIRLSRWKESDVLYNSNSVKSSVRNTNWEEKKKRGEMKGLVSAITMTSWQWGTGARFSKVPKTFRARKAIRETPTCLICKAGLFICCIGNKNQNNCKVSCLETPSFWRYKENYVTRIASEKSRDFWETGPWTAKI